MHAAEINLHRAPDEAILFRAEQDQRTVVTADLDYPRLLALARAVQPSLVLFRGGNWTEADVIDRLHAVLDSVRSEEIACSIIVVDRDRVRRRKLPIE